MKPLMEERELDSSPELLDLEQINLKTNEQKVLYGLIAFPSQKDTDICSILGMRKSTFSTIKSRLEEAKLFRRVMLPGFPRINAELFVILSARMALSNQDNEERLEMLSGVFNLFREDVFVVGESENLIVFSISKNFTNYDLNLQTLRQTGIKNKIFLRTGLNYQILPFETTRFERFFSYGPLINRLFDLKFKNKEADRDDLIYEDQIKQLSESNEKMVYEFSNTERKVFQGLLEHPDDSNRELAEKIEVSKNTLASMKKKFLTENVLLPRVVPDLLKLGIKLLIFFFGQFDPDSAPGERQNGIANCDEVLKPILLAVKDSDFYILYAVTSFEEYHSLSTKVMTFFSEKKLIAPNYNTVIFSLPHAKIIKEHDYLPLVDKLLVH
jgi:DNA-binding MarR family transcriptional regulator